MRTYYLIKDALKAFIYRTIMFLLYLEDRGLFKIRWAKYPLIRQLAQITDTAKALNQNKLELAFSSFDLLLRTHRNTHNNFIIILFYEKALKKNNVEFSKRFLKSIFHYSTNFLNFPRTIDARIARLFGDLGALALRVGEENSAHYFWQISNYLINYPEKQKILVACWDLEDYARDRNLKFKKIHNEEPYNSISPVSIDAKGTMPGQNYKTTFPEVIVCELPNVSLRATCVVLAEEVFSSSNKYVPNEIDSENIPKLISLESHARPWDRGVAGHMHYVVGMTDEKRVTLNIPTLVPRIVPAGLLLTGRAAVNYFHWIIECMTKLQDVEALTEYADLPLVVHGDLHLQQLEAFKLAFGKRAENIISYIPQLGLHFEKLVVLTSPAKTADDPYLSWDQRFSIHPGPARFFINRILERLNLTQTKGTRKIYLDRPKARRSVDNKNIPAMFKDAGFEMIIPERLSFADQVRLFRQASVIAGPAGAAFTNIIFCNPKTKILLLNSEYNRTNIVFPELARLADSEVIQVTGRNIETPHLRFGMIEAVDRYHLPYKISPKTVKNALSMIK